MMSFNHGPCAARRAVLVVTLFTSLALPGRSEAAPTVWPLDDAAVDEARDLLLRADLLDELAAGADASALAAERGAEKRDRQAQHLRELAAHSNDVRLLQRASALEAEAAVTRAAARRQHDRADENRRSANEMRARAIRLSRGDEPALAHDECDPPFHYDAQGRKHYVVSCL